MKTIELKTNVVNITTPRNEDTQAYTVSLSSEVNGVPQKLEGYWGDVSGLEVGGVSNFLRLIDGKQRAVLATRVEYANSVIKKAMAHWNKDVTKVVFGIDADIGKEVGVSVDQFLGEDYIVSAALYEDCAAKKIARDLENAVNKTQPHDDPNVFFIFSDKDKANKKLSICVLNEDEAKQVTIELAVKANTCSMFTHIEEADVIQVIETDINNKSVVLESKGLLLSHIEESMKKIFSMYNDELRRTKRAGNLFSVFQGCPW